MRRAVFAALLALGLAGPAAAQDQTLADIRQELSVLFVEIQRLKRELSTTGGAATSVGGDTLQRVDLIESELRRLTSKTEELEFRIARVVKDGTNRIGDLEFRLCELEPGCDIGSLAQTSTLGGETAAAAPETAATPASGNGGAEFAVGEQADFDRAEAAFDEGDYRTAADLFQGFTETYTGGPFTAEAHFLRGEALTALGETSAAARAYLTAFSGEPRGPRGADALLRLGTSLAELDQRAEACTTLGEVRARFPDSPRVEEADAARLQLGCP